MPPPVQLAPVDSEAGSIELVRRGEQAVASFFDVSVAAVALTTANFTALDWYARLLTLCKSKDEKVQMKALQELRKALRDNLQLAGYIQSQNAKLNGKDEHGRDVTLALETNRLITFLESRPPAAYPNGAGPILLEPDSLPRADPARSDADPGPRPSGEHQAEPPATPAGPPPPVDVPPGAAGDDQGYGGLSL